MYGPTGEGSPYLPSLQASGARWLRVSVDWRQIEPHNTTPDQYDWRHADRVLAAAQDACVHIIATHRSAPAWAASNPDGQIDRTNLDELAEYLTALVERYDGDGKDDAPGSRWCATGSYITSRTWSQPGRRAMRRTNMPPC